MTLNGTQTAQNIQNSGRRERLGQMGQDAKRMVNLLLNHAGQQEGIQRRIRLANYAVAAFVMLFGLLSFTEFGKQKFGDFLSLAICVMGAMFLLLEAYTPHMLDDPNPERFRDYAFYILKYARDIDTHLANTELDSVM